MTNPAAQTPGPDHAAATPNAIIADPAVRKAIYGVITAIGALLVVYGIVSQDQINAWIELVGNLLMVGSGALAIVNTPKQR